MTYRVLVTGSRSLTTRHEAAGRLVTRLTGLLHDVFQLERIGILTVAHGGCPRGADVIAAAWAVDNEPWTLSEPHPADWDRCIETCWPGHRTRKKPGDVDHPGELDDYCPNAGPRRNAYMVSLGADLCLVAYAPGPRSPGTTSCARMAGRAGIPLVFV